jgi:hypothetical protein
MPFAWEMRAKTTFVLELEEESVIRKFRTTVADGKDDNTKFYNLDALISVGYLVSSVLATQFRQWVTQVLREFVIQGYVLDKKRLKNRVFLGEDYFERLLEETGEIRLSERHFYHKITDIYATSVDYTMDPPTNKVVFEKTDSTSYLFQIFWGKPKRFWRKTIGIHTESVICALR